MAWHAELDIEMTRKQLEQRRFLAAKDIESGLSQAEIARKFKVSESSVSRWVKSIKEEGKDGLKRRKPTGRNTKLSEEQKMELVQILIKGATESGYQTDAWTGKRVSDIIEKRFGVEYHFKHMPRLLRKLGFRRIKPKKKAIERNEEKRKEWLETRWELVKKN